MPMKIAVKVEDNKSSNFLGALQKWYIESRYYHLLLIGSEMLKENTDQSNMIR